MHADSPIRNLKELAAYAKANPGAASVRGTGIDSENHLAMLEYQKVAGVKINHNPFKGASEVQDALASKQVVVGAINAGEALQYSKAGTPLCHLGQMSAARTVLRPKVCRPRSASVFSMRLNALQLIQNFRLRRQAILLRCVICGPRNMK